MEINIMTATVIGSRDAASYPAKVGSAATAVSTRRRFAGIDRTHVSAPRAHTV
ncbi:MULTISPECIES: hypothetical protein [Sanguibacter]|jgi:hypothetical protein|uniref:Uncharacterized protein n=1 Tax=Sanguibacter inulinus TaxID=60922 RepID=A0A853EPW7_9MICO|nr:MULTISPECIES: hypothetical protein [Sanguibacter]MBF0721202.1 hypothetical protein [Sanguibacter inulinus]NYS92347.1 hypothetical protein [Sanguibacter inulinus]